MAATSTYQRYDAGVAAHSWIAVALAMLGLAAGCGYALALGELAGLYIGLSLVCAIAVLFDFRVGAVLLVLMLPSSASALFPHGLLGITGLNPLNLMLAATLGSYILHGRLRRAGPLVPLQVALLYILPIAVAGAIGANQIDLIPAFMIDSGAVTFATPVQYVITSLLKPFFVVLVALIVGAAAARSRRPERFIAAIALSALAIGLIQIGFVIAEGAPLGAMAARETRSFYAPLGLHANTLGRMHMHAFALLLFIWADLKHPRLRTLVLCALIVAAAALLLTFSRAAIGGAALIAALFMLWKFNSRTLVLGVLGFMAVVFLAGDLLYTRMTHGLDEGANAVSAGRIEGLWLPLIPDLLSTPPWGNGVGSIAWSSAMATGLITPTTHPHNAFIESLLDLGILGTALLLAFYGYVWKGLRRLAADEKVAPELRALFQGAIAALAALFVTGLVGSSLRPEPEAAFLWIAIGLMYGLRGRKPAG